MAWQSPVTWSTIQAALRSFVADQLEITTIWAKQDAPAPAYPYAELDFVTGPIRQHHDRRHKRDNEDTTMTVFSIGDRTRTLSVESMVSFEGLAWDYDTDANARMTLLQAAFGCSEHQTTLGTSGIGILDVGPVQDRRTALDAGWLSRAGFDVTIHCVSLIEVGTVETVETIRVTSEFDSPADFEDLELGPDS